MSQTGSRQTSHDIHPLFLDRWSPRAYTGEALVKDDLLKILDAARWAPSASNHQPWRFAWALNGTDHWPVFVDLLAEGNRRWAKNAGALVVIISRTFNVNRDGERSSSWTHAFDAGAAWMALALQAHLSGYHAHGMGGLDRDRALGILDVPEGYRVEIAVAIGKLAPADTLPDDLKAREVKSDRLPLEQLAFEGSFGQ